MRHQYKGTLITFEGIDGAGKTELLSRVAQQLKSDGHEVFVTKEPGGTNIGRMLKKVLLEEEKACDPRVEFLLFAADRAEHFSKLIIPALERGMVVLSDRMADSSLAYQGFGRGLPCDLIEKVNQWAMHGIEPDITFYLHISYAQARARRMARNGESHSMEQADEPFWQRVISGYETLAQRHSRIVTLDGHDSRDRLFEHAYHTLAQFLRRKHVEHHGNSSPSQSMHDKRGPS